MNAMLCSPAYKWISRFISVVLIGACVALSFIPFVCAQEEEAVSYTPLHTFATVFLSLSLWLFIFSAMYFLTHRKSQKLKMLFIGCCVLVVLSVVLYVLIFNIHKL